MFNKKNPMRYFSGSTFARLPLYKLAAGGTAVVLTASIGLGAFAASVGPLSAPEPSPTPIVTATPETAATPTPSPTPSPTPEPDKPLTMEASVIQQDAAYTGVGGGEVQRLLRQVQRKCASGIRGNWN